MLFAALIGLLVLLLAALHKAVAWGVISMAREGKAPAFQFYAGDWLADEDVRAMSLAERGAYIDLLAFAWREGSIPDDSDRCSRLLGCGARELAKCWPTVRARFTETGAPDGRLVSARLEEYRAELAEATSGASKGGTVSASKLSPEQRVERARHAARARYGVQTEMLTSEQTCEQVAEQQMLSPANTASASASASATASASASAGPEEAKHTPARAIPGGTQQVLDALVQHGKITAPPAALVEAFTSIGASLAAAGKGDRDELAAQAVVAYEKYRKSLSIPPGWNKPAVEKHSAEIQRLIAGVEPSRASPGKGPAIVMHPDSVTDVEKLF